ncbi:SCP-like protein [Ancylostoma ceylanicum]|uniref:SCP-like protein n=1 Tax=Ancylostoma ceylanicum TaxID=53326 RepID=A0A0D6LY79_9BILA|nr:SCP-like protein [Ancylostoma ceylanicum]
MAHQFQKYDCSLEQTAMKWANHSQCQMKRSDYDVGENLYVVGGNTSESLEHAAESAIASWADEISQVGINFQLNITPNILHAAQVLSDKAETIGCGVIKCDAGGIMVVCHYYPAMDMSLVEANIQKVHTVQNTDEGRTVLPENVVQTMGKYKN